MIFDTHAHYDDPAFDADRDELLSALPRRGVGLVLNPGCDVPSSRAAAALAQLYPFVYAAAGIHPENCHGAGAADFAAVAALCALPKVVAVGEIGLDYHWPENPPREFQLSVFRRQLTLAQTLGLPAIVHARDAHGDTLTLLREFPGVRGVLHCFSGSAEMAKEVLRLGWYLGFDGPVTYQNARRARAVVAVTPPERMLVETDAPYLPPVPLRGTRNHSGNLPLVLETLSAWTGLSAGELENRTAQNGRTLFAIPAD